MRHIDTAREAHGHPSRRNMELRTRCWALIAEASELKNFGYEAALDAKEDHQWAQNMTLVKNLALSFAAAKKKNMLIKQSKLDE